MTSSDKDWGRDRQNSNHSHNSPRTVEDDSHEEKDPEDELGGIYSYRFEPHLGNEEEDIEEEPIIPADIEWLQDSWMILYFLI